MPRLLLFDGHGLAFRAFYALPEMRNSKGEPVHAILGFVNMVLRFLEAGKPEYAAMSFDRGRPAFRIEQLADYKGQREHAPEGLSWQFPWIEKVAQALRLPTYAMPGFEADDCIGTMARKAEADGMDV
ncbi:MAG TPA: DNA polymerase I, partial [Candidatus Xenobia bacterium]